MEITRAEYPEFILPPDIKDHIDARQVTMVFHVNIRWAQNKSDMLFTLFEQCNWRFEVIMFSETWNKNDTDMVVLPGLRNFNFQMR